MPKGLAQYVRKISSRRHGTPTEFAKRCKDNGMGWMAIAGPWHDRRGEKFINRPHECRRYLDALARVGVEPFVWGYPWQGSERGFAKAMRQCAGDHRRGLLDPELGSNPTRSKRGPRFTEAEDHARLLVRLMAEEGFDVCGLSSFGSGVRMRWFPMRAFIGALLERFAGRTFCGGQTYVEDRRVDPSMADYLRIVDESGADLIRPGVAGGDIELVPNFGLYKFVKRDPSKPLRGKNRKAIKKTPDELYSHLGEFIDDGEPVDALIGWAENFTDRRLWAVLRRFARQMERGACRLDTAA